MSRADVMEAETVALWNARVEDEDEKIKSLMYSEWNEPVDSFALAMKQKLSVKAAEGFYGWDDPLYKDIIEQKLYKHVERQRSGGHQLIDIANLAMMLWHFEQKEAKPND